VAFLQELEYFFKCHVRGEFTAENVAGFGQHRKLETGVRGFPLFGALY
jgi:hypothetical protein